MKVQSLKYNLRRAIRMICQYDRWYLPLGLCRALLSTLVPLGSVWLSAAVLDGLLQKQPFDSLFLQALLFLMVIFCTGAVGAVIQRRQDISREYMGRAFRFKVSEKTLSMDYEMLDDPQTRKLRDEISMSSHWGYGFLGVIDLFIQLMQHLCSLLISAGLLLWLLISAGRNAWVTFLYILAVVSILMLVTRVRTKWTKEMDGAMNAANPQMSLFFYLLNESGTSYRTGKDVRIYRAYALFESFVRNTYGKMRNTLGKKLLITECKIRATQGFIDSLVLGAGYGLATVLALLGQITAGQILLFSGAVSQFGGALCALAGGLTDAKFTVNRIVPTLDYLELQDQQYKGTLPVEKRDDDEYEIEFHDVSFQYPGQKRWALRHVNLKLSIGEKLAVVGLNGSGKTTLVKLLTRLYDPTEGSITLNGIDIRKYDREEYRSLFSVVFQDFKLLSFSLGQNVAASAHVEAPRAKEALRQAGFGERLDTLPEGLDTALYQDFEENGVEVSGGEAQKIALARALYKRAPFIVLDEPTAALDPLAEADVYARFDAIVGNRTALYISHRLSSCRFCNDIVVFEEGCMVQRGSHQMLIQEGGLYARLWNAQAQYYTDTADHPFLSRRPQVVESSPSSTGG